MITDNNKMQKPDPLAPDHIKTDAFRTNGSYTYSLWMV
jgi:hypothetical protein